MTSQEEEQEKFESQSQEVFDPTTTIIQPKIGRFRKKAVKKGLDRTILLLNVIISTLLDLASIVMPGLLTIRQGMNAGKTALTIVQEGLGIPTQKIPRPEILKTATLLTGSFLAVGLQTVAVMSYFIPALIFLAPAFSLASTLIGTALATYDLIKKFKRRNDANKDYPMGKLKFQSALARASFAYTTLAVATVLFFIPGVQLVTIAAISILATASALMLGFKIWKTLKRHRERSKVAPASENITEAPTEVPAPVSNNHARALHIAVPQNIDISPLPTLDSCSDLSELSTPTKASSTVSTESNETSLTRSQSSSSLESQAITVESPVKLKRGISVSSFFAPSDQKYVNTLSETNSEINQP